MAETTAEQPLEELDIDSYTTESEVPVEGEYTSESMASRFGEPQPAAGLGRRKNAIARVRIVPGTGKWKINGRTLEDYFPNKVHQQVVSEPFSTAAVAGSYDVIARIHGGGVTGQAGALRLGVARCLNSVDEEASRPSLKKAGMLTRDARIKERKKVGLKRARKAPQYAKR